MGVLWPGRTGGTAVADRITGFGPLPPLPAQDDDSSALSGAAPAPSLAATLRLAVLVALGHGAAALLSSGLSREPGSVANVWYANALVVAVLLRQPPARWPWLLAAAGAANALVNLSWGDDGVLIGLLLVPNLLEMALAAWLLRQVGLTRQPLRAPGTLLRLLLYGAVLPQMASSALVTLLLGMRGEPDTWLMGLTWLESGTIGAVSVLPLAIALADRPWQTLRGLLGDARVLLMLPLSVGVSLLCMATMPYPFVYLLLPLLAAAMWLDVAAVALLTLAVSLTMAVSLSTGVLLPPPATAAWQLGLVYLALAAVLVPALLLGAAVAAWRDDHARLRQRSQELERAHAGLRQFVHAASHDLREPLNAITQFNALVLADHGEQLPATARGWLGLVGDEAARMRGVLDDVLQYAQVQRLQLPHLQAVPLDEVLARCVTALPAAQRACVQLGPLPLVAGDAPLLELLFGHLLANALKFVPPGGMPEVRVSGTTHEGWAAVVVADRGIGIAEDDLARLFKPFQRLQRRADYPGTGLGLAICQQVAAALGGDIVLRSRPGQGTRVLVRLPLWAR